MVIVYILAGVILSTLMSWLILMKPSGKKHPNEPEMRKFIYAHRGLHDKNIGIPENSMAAFDRAVSEGYGIELDVHISADGTPVVIHDTSLLRTMEAAGIAAPAHCRSGECGWCHSKLVSGEVYTPKSVDGRREADYIYGYIHPCCAFPLSDLVIEVPPMAK